MSRVRSLLALSAALWAAAPSEAIVWQAAIKERMVSLLQHPYGADSALRVRRDVQDLGFSSFTLIVRAQMMGRTENAVFLPPARSRRENLETMFSSLQQGRAGIVLKPVIFESPEFGRVPNRMLDIAPQNPRAWLGSYQQAIAVYYGAAFRRDIREFVVGTGLHNVWKPELATNWVAILQEVRRKVGPQARLSFELSSEADLIALESWKRQAPASFAQVSGLLNMIRVSIVPTEGNPFQTGRTIADRVERVKELMPSALITIANVTVPACRGYTVNEDEVTCPAGSTYDKVFGLMNLQSVFGGLRTVPEYLRSSINTFEFLEATTDREPDDWDFDPRFPYYNDQTGPVFLQEFHGDWTTIESRSQVPAHREPASASFGGRAPAATPNVAATKLSCVYYDYAGGQDYIGPLHARMLTNLMGAFPRWKTEFRSVSDYRSGDLNACGVAFYLATNYALETPNSFLSEFSAFSFNKTAVWFNYKLHSLKPVYDRVAAARGKPGLPFDAEVIEQPLEQPTRTNVDPGFFRYFDYKGETFEKLAMWDVVANRFMSSPELAIVTIDDARRTEILAKARHSVQPRQTPYVVRTQQPQGGLWYFADSPLTYVHYEDRYLILCDLMWDILGEQAPAGPLGAMVRIEDVNPSQRSQDLRWTIDYLGSQNVPYSLAVIPYYSNAYGTEFSERRPLLRPVTEFRDFVGSLRYAVAQGANIVWHGVYHQAGDLISGYDGTSGPDYEFWLYPENTPIPADSSDFVLDLLEMGESVFKRLNIKPVAWEVPHYAASALDSVMFGKLFQWSYHRSLYFWSDTEQDAPLGPQHEMFKCTTDACKAERRTLARQTRVDTHSLNFAGQPIPYRVWKDIYGQSLIPETLGMIDYPFYSDHTWRPVSRPEDLLRRAKKLRVIRGSFASFFWHPDLVSENLPYYVRHPGSYEREGGQNTLRTMVDGLRSLGYEFKNVADCNLFPQEGCRNL